MITNISNAVGTVENIASKKLDINSGHLESNISKYTSSKFNTREENYGINIRFTVNDESYETIDKAIIGFNYKESSIRATLVLEKSFHRRYS